MDAVDLTLWLETWGYIGLLVLLLATGIGSPVPEDLLLLCAGYLVSVGVLEWPLTCLVAGLGVVSSDVVVYLAGRHVAWRSERHAGTLLSPERLRRATRWFDRWVIASCSSGAWCQGRGRWWYTAGMSRCRSDSSCG
jgi:membrane protein DedA with SNARE-associated domain